MMPIALAVCLFAIGQGNRPPLHEPGSEGVLYTMLSDCEIHPVGGYRSRSAVMEAIKLSKADDDEGLDKMAEDGKRVILPSGTRVRVLAYFTGPIDDVASMNGDYCEIRVLTGSEKKESYYVFARVIRTEPLDFAGAPQPDIRKPDEYAKALQSLDRHVFSRSAAIYADVLARTSKLPKGSPERERIISKTLGAALPEFRTRFGVTIRELTYAIKCGQHCNWPIEGVGKSKVPSLDKKAASALAVAKALEATNRKAAIDAYRKVAVDFPGTPEATAATKRAEALGKAR